MSETIEIVVNGERISGGDVRMTLVDLREPGRWAPTGPASMVGGCAHGDRRRCSEPIVPMPPRRHGEDVSMVEGVAEPKQLHLLQQAMRERSTPSNAACTGLRDGGAARGEGLVTDEAANRQP